MAIRLDQTKNWLASNIISRMTPLSLVYFEEPYMICRTHTTAKSEYCSWLSLAVFGYGTYEWKAKFYKPLANAHQFLGLFELHHGWMGEGIIAVWHDGINYALSVAWAGTETKVVLAGQDWTKERTFRIVWAKGKVELYVDGTKVTTVITNVPEKPMSLFSEVGVPTDVSPAEEPLVYFNLESFRKVA